MKGAAEKSILLALGKRIADIRKKRGVTLDWLSQRMAISKGNLSDIERGKRDPRFLTLLAIAQGLQISLKELILERKKR